MALSNALIDIEAEAIDVAFRVGHPVMDSWIARPPDRYSLSLVPVRIARYSTSQIRRIYAANLHSFAIPCRFGKWSM
ncbi:hypothetical protein P4S72_21415 [Vibrio sp. PP-XX7]